jgi:hypothetical protein
MHVLRVEFSGSLIGIQRIVDLIVAGFIL